MEKPVATKKFTITFNQSPSPTVEGRIFFYTHDEALVNLAGEFGALLPIQGIPGKYLLTVSALYNFDEVLSYLQSFEEV